MSWSEAEVETILELMRGGATVQTGGSRCHTTHFFRAGEWRWENFDEGYTEEFASSEDEIRRLIASNPELFREVLKAPRWRAFREAFLADDPSARERLRHALEYGDRHDHGTILDAVLAWPDEQPSAEVVAAIESNLGGFTAYHVFMTAAGWDRSPEVARKGLAFVERLREMVGEPPGLLWLRASFHEQAGDLAAAERDLVHELERAAEDDWRCATYEQSLARVHGRIATGP